MSGIPLQQLTLSDDDTLWVSRLPIDRLGDLDSVLASIAEVQALAFVGTGALVQSTISEGNAESFGRNHFLLQGIVGTGFVHVMNPRPELADVLDEQLEKAAVNISFNGFTFLRPESAALTESFNAEEYLNTMRQRRVDITLLEQERVCYIHFPIWEPTDLPEGTSPEDLIKHKKAALTFYRKNAIRKGFITGIIRDNITRTIERREEPHVRAFTRVSDDTYDEVKQMPSLESFLDMCNDCELHPHISLGALGPMRPDAACNMTICETNPVTGQRECRLNTDKPYAT